MIPLVNYQQEHLLRQIAQVGTCTHLKVNCSQKNLMFDNVKYRQGNDTNSTRHHIVSDFCACICLEEQCYFQ
jgi:hypothetical protein